MWGWREAKKTGTEGKENPSEIERHVTQTEKVRQVYEQRERGGHKGRERESKREEGIVRIRLEGRQNKMQLSDTSLNLILDRASRDRLGEIILMEN